MPSTPTSELSQLSLGSSMPPTARRRSYASSRGQAREDVSSSEDESDSGTSMMGGDSDEEDPFLIRSPNRLTYKLNGLHPDVRSVARDTFQDPPKITLQYCRLQNNVYAFQMTELVHQSIRIGPPNSDQPHPHCSCNKTAVPCRHVFWLMDQLTKQTLYDHDVDAPLTLTPHGYPAEIGHPFDDISNFHLDLLAESLHCDMGEVDSDEETRINEHRVLEVRELLASMAAVPPEKFRPDIFTTPRRGKKPLKRGDLEQTLFRILLDNNELFNYLLSLARPTDSIRDPFRKLSQRATRVLAELDDHCSTSPHPGSTGFHAETPTSTHSLSPTQTASLGFKISCDVPWAAHHILGIISSIRAAIYPIHASTPSQRISAARALVRIFSNVSDRNRDIHPGETPADRNLYARLIGTRDEDFIIPILTDLREAASQFLHNLEVVQYRLGVHGAPITYIEKFNDLITVLRTYPQPGSSRSSPGGAGSKRHGQDSSSSRDPKRVK
ncbi:hypothetical protein jhhlp_007304 [Lomentospora prolificans]|uniref:SWIM-type domain-containing protein n=1 Tax=Lomentospora prolificans TaxID=41688 RepID=A0A2N3N296_9PEZI|nr:hypothetical protein jhhlp_007304 [Lomentospora prolificans]